MSRMSTIALGVASVLPFCALVFFTASGFGDPQGSELPPSVVAFGLMMLIGFVLVVFYIVHAVRNNSLSPGAKTLWVVLLAAFGILSVPVYWYAHFWKTADESPVREGAL